MKLLLSRAGAEQKRKTCQGISWDRKSVKRELSGIWGEKKTTKQNNKGVSRPTIQEREVFGKWVWREWTISACPNTCIASHNSLLLSYCKSAVPYTEYHFLSSFFQALRLVLVSSLSCLIFSTLLWRYVYYYTPPEQSCNIITALNWI